MDRKSLCQENYNRLVQLRICLEDGSLRSDGKSFSKGYSDLILERIPHLDNYNGVCKAISIAHYSIYGKLRYQNPEMVLLVFPLEKTVKAFSFHSELSSVCESVYPEPGVVSFTAMDEQNSYLYLWLGDLIAQGHGVRWCKEERKELESIS